MGNDGDEVSPVNWRQAFGGRVVRVAGAARGLGTIYGERYRGMVLYGSYARGEADEGSDVDLLLLLDGDVARVPQG
ncbi:MAG: nucleotidyltransferase domain-containing protein [Rubrobacteraceae bacterium]